MTPAATGRGPAASLEMGVPRSEAGGGTFGVRRGGVFREAGNRMAMVPLPFNDAPGEVPDATLAERVREGDHDAFRLLFDRYADRLMDFAIGFVHSRDAAQDVVADVFFALWRGHAEWLPDRVSTYLFAAVRHRCHTYRTRAHVRHEIDLSDLGDDDASAVVDATPLVIDRLDEGALYARVEKVLDTLPPQRKAAAMLRWREGMGFDEIAHALQISENAARLQVSRALKVVRAALGATGPAD